MGVQTKIINRLRDEQKVKIQEDEALKRPKQMELKRIEATLADRDRLDVRKQFEYENLHRFLKKKGHMRSCQD